MANYRNRSMDDTLAITKAMADETRLRVLMALQGGELCGCELIELLELAPSTISKHMSILRQARLIEVRKDGRWHYYRLTETDEPSLPVRTALAWLDSAIGASPMVLSDRKRLKQICRQSKANNSACCRDESSQIH